MYSPRIHPLLMITGIQQHRTGSGWYLQIKIWFYINGYEYFANYPYLVIIISGCNTVCSGAAGCGRVRFGLFHCRRLTTILTTIWQWSSIGWTTCRNSWMRTRFSIGTCGIWAPAFELPYKSSLAGQTLPFHKLSDNCFNGLCSL